MALSSPSFLPNRAFPLRPPVLAALASALLCLSSSAVTFYVDQITGNDGNTGTSPAQAFETIQRAANAASAGDTVEIATGTYREQVALPRSGTASQPIVFRAATGANVVVSAADLVTGWSPVAGRTDTWVANVNWNAGNDRDNNTLFVDGDLKFEGRVFAEVDPIHIDNWATLPQGNLSQTSLTASDLAGWGDDFWNGAKIRYHSFDYIITTTEIADYVSSSGTITFSSPASFVQKQDGGCYIFDSLETLNRPGEWYKGKASDGAGEESKLYYRADSGQDPNSLEIEFKRRAFAFSAGSRDHIHLIGLTFRGGAIETNTATDHLFVQGNSFYGYDKGTYGRLYFEGNDHVIRDNTFRQIYGSLFTTSGRGLQFVNNLCEEFGYDGVAKGIIATQAREMLVSHNTFRKFAESFMDGYPVASEVKYNVFEDAGTLTYDTGVFDSDGGNGNSSYSIVHHNIFRDTSARGIYEAFYGLNNNLVVHHNVFYNFSNQTITRPVARFLGNEFRHAYHNTFITDIATAPQGSLDARDAIQTRYNNNLQITVDNVSAIGVDMRGNHNYVPGDFVDFANQDFQLAPGSAAIDIGIPIPGVNDRFIGAAPDAGAYEFGRPAWVAGHNFASPPTPTFDWTPLPSTNGYLNGLFLQGIGDWTLDQGTPASADRNSWNLQQSGASLTGVFRTQSVEFEPTEAMSRTFTGLKPNTEYTLAMATRIIDEVTRADQYSSSSGSISTGFHRLVHYVSDLTAGEWVAYQNVDFGQPGQFDQLDILHIRDPNQGFPSDVSGVSLEVRLGSSSGTLLARFDSLTDGTTFDRWRANRTELLTSVSGLQTIYLSATGGNSSKLGFGSIRLLNSALPSSDQLTATISSPGGQSTIAKIGLPDWYTGYEEISFRTGPSATSALVSLHNKGRINAYFDRLYLSEGYETRGGSPALVGSGSVSTRSLNLTNGASANEASDGNASTFATTEDHPGSWIQTDLGRSIPFYGIRLTPPASAPAQMGNFRVAIWTDDPALGGREVWQKDYLTDGEVLPADGSLFIHSDTRANDGRTQLGRSIGRFIRVTLLGTTESGDHRLSIAEISALEFDLANFALTDGLPVQSSTSGSQSALAAIDADRSSASSTSTSDTDSWIDIRFQQDMSIGQIELINRADDTTGELSNFTISVWDGIPGSGGNQLWQKDYYSEGSVQPGGSFFVEGGAVSDDSSRRLASLHTARVVRVQLRGKNGVGNGRLSLAEFRIRPTDLVPSRDNLVRNSTLTQSRNHYGDTGTNAIGFPTDAADGIIIPDSNFTTATNIPNAWWQTEINSSAQIGQIVIFNRNGGVANRLNNFEVSVWDDDPATGGSKIWSRNYNYSSSASTYSESSSIGDGGALIINGDATSGGVRLDSLSTGKVVRVQLNGQNFLSLVEVQVWRPFTSIDLQQLVYNYDPGTPDSIFQNAQWLSANVSGEATFIGSVTETSRPNTGQNAYNQDFIEGTAPAEFRHRLANGRYRLTYNMADPSSSLDNMYLFAEGGFLSTGITNPAGQNTTRDSIVDVADGELNLIIGDADAASPRWVINRLVITRIPSAPPVFSRAAGLVPTGVDTQALNSDTRGTVYVMTDGTDPRLSNGTVNPSATTASTSEPVVTTLQDFENLTPPSLPSGWSSNSSSRANTQPGSGVNGSISLRIDDVSGTGETNVTSAAFPVADTSREIRFDHDYDLGGADDGGILEISIGSGAFAELTAAGGQFIENGYTGNISSFFGSNPLEGRSAWLGNSNGFVTTRFLLPQSAVGQQVTLRWRLGQAFSFSESGGDWKIDNIRQAFVNVGLVQFPISGDVSFTARTLIGDDWSGLRTVQYLLDGDQDQLPDSLEQTLYGNTTATNGLGDYDNDGQSDATEYFAGTALDDANSKFTVSGVEALTENTIQIAWQTVPGRRYTLYSSTSLAANSWTPVAEDVLATSATTTYNHTKSSPKEFFRVEVKAAE